MAYTEDGAPERRPKSTSTNIVGRNDDTGIEGEAPSSFRNYEDETDLEDDHQRANSRDDDDGVDSQTNPPGLGRLSEDSGSSLPDDSSKLNPRTRSGVIPPERLSSLRSQRMPETQRDSYEGEEQPPPRPEEIEAAKKILAEAERRNRRNASRSVRSPATERSATPPPIFRPHNVTVDRDVHRNIHIDDDIDADDTETEAGRTTSIASRAGSVLPTEDELRCRLVGAHNGRPNRPSTSKKPMMARLRTPVLDNYQFYQAEPAPRVPRSRNGEREPMPPRRPYSKSRRALSDELDNDIDQGYESSRPPVPHLDRTSLADRRRYSDGAASISIHSTSKQSVLSTTSMNRMPDFFGQGIFQTVLHNPTTAHQLLRFSESRLCSENVEFLAQVERFQKTLEQLTGILATLQKSFLSDASARQIEVPVHLMKAIRRDMRQLVAGSLPTMETLFNDTQEHIESIVYQQIYPRFVRHQLSMSATGALANDRHRYQGLGDCFTLTKPSKADNPIVYASDGFVKVTGYTRPEVIPRNCRFLQGSHTDRDAVRRLKVGINERRETVELLLNYRKNGEPFWNLLYVAPLYNEQGKLEFFIGGQVNCSTTIHSNADVMRVLSISDTDEPEEQEKKIQPQLQPGRQLTARQKLLNAFRLRSEEPKPVFTGDAGMEQRTLERMEGQGLDAQVKEFYTAYSKYMVVRTDNWVVRFFSEGLTEVLHPANTTSGPIVGEDLFAFLKRNMMGGGASSASSQTAEVKSRVRGAVRAGSPVSVELRLQTRRSVIFRGDEKFVLHFTPLKDENADVHLVVVTLAPSMT